MAKRLVPDRFLATALVRLVRLVRLVLLVVLGGCDLGGEGAEARPEHASAYAAAAAIPRFDPARARLDSMRLEAAYERAAAMPKLRSLLVSWRGQLIGEAYFHGATRSAPANIKSASKTVLSALVGIAIADGRIQGVHATLGALLPRATSGLDSARRAITVEDLLTMRAGLQSTSFENYGSWVSSANWVRDALGRPLVAPAGHAGGPMIYSTGSSHLLSAALTRATGRSTFELASRRLARPLGVRLPRWTTDPQGIYFGGNEMRLTPRAMIAFGELYARGGRAADGVQVIPSAWIDSSWVPRTSSPWSGFRYGYGWWMRTSNGSPVYFAWGYGGQFIFVVPERELVIAVTSDPAPSSRERGHLGAIHALLDDLLIPAIAN